VGGGAIFTQLSNEIEAGEEGGKKDSYLQKKEKEQDGESGKKRI